MNPFDRQTVYLRNPHGGVEDIAAQYAAGHRTFLLTMQDYDWKFDAWQTVISRIDPFPDAVWLPWAFLNTDADCWVLRGLAQHAYLKQTAKLRRPAACWNAEKPLDPVQTGGAKIHLDNLIASAAGCDVLLSTEPWAFEGVPWGTVPAHWIIDVQVFPAENSVSATGARDCRARFYTLGAPCRVHFQHGIHDTSPAALPYPETGRFSIYAVDDMDGNYARWQADPLTPLPTYVFPYNGPWYGPSSPKCPNRTGTRHPQVMVVKRALHNAGYGEFTNPDAVWNRAAEAAARRLQQDKGIYATGQYGTATWQALRSLSSAVPGKTYAVAAA